MRSERERERQFNKSDEVATYRISRRRRTGRHQDSGPDTNEKKRRDGEIGEATDFSIFRQRLFSNKRKVNNGRLKSRWNEIP